MLFIRLIIFMSLIIINAQHKAPKEIKFEAEKALSYYPELEETNITFKFKKRINKSTMRAQPKFWSLLQGRKKRKYVVLISERIKISDTVFLTKDIPQDILIGWLGHELGHVMDYKNRNSLNLIGFGFKYLFSGNYIKEAERIADTFAVSHGMADYILKTKAFILDNADIEERYKDRIRKYYLSPEEIMALVEEKDLSSHKN